MANNPPQESTKSCPKCGNTELALMSTQNLKFCPCGTWIPWFKEPHQKPYR